MIKVYESGGNLRYGQVSKITVDGKEIEYNDKWVVLKKLESLGSTKIDMHFFNYMREQDKRLDEAIDMIHELENKVRSLDDEMLSLRFKVDKTKNAK